MLKKKIAIKIIPAVAVNAVERLVSESLKGMWPSQVSPDHRLRITVSVSRGHVQAFKNYLLHSYKDLSAY